MTNNAIPKYLPMLLLAALVVIGFILRIYALDHQSYWLDEGYTITTSQAIAKHGYPLLDSGFIWYKKNVLHHYLTALPIKLFGVNPWSVRLISVLFGTMSLWLLYRLAKKLFEKESIALLSAGFLAFSHWAIVWSRQARSYALFQFLYLLGIYLLVGLLEKFTLKRFGLFALVAVLSIGVHDSGIIILPFGLILLTWHYRQNLKNYLVATSWKKYWWLAIIILSGLVLAGLKTNKFIELFSTKPFLTAGNYWGWLWANYNFLLLCSLVALLYLLKQKLERTKGLIFLLFYGLALTLTIAFNDFTEFRYIFFLFPLMILLAVYILVTAASHLKNKYIAYGVVISMLVLTNLNNLEFYPKNYYELDLFVPNPNFNGAYATIKEQWQTNDLIISPYIPLDMAYLGRSDYFLLMSFSGKPTELDSYKYNPYDLYYKKPLIKNVGELRGVMSQGHGFVIFDQLALNRLGSDYFSLLQTQTRQIFHEDKQPNSSIWVFKF